MNLVLSFLDEHRDRLEALGLASRKPLSALMVTPRFHTSRNAVFLLFPEGSADPVLVAKVSRRDDPGGFLSREAANLETIQAMRPGGFDSIPRLVACDVHEQELVLVETAITGRLMRPSLVRRDPEHCIEAVMDWLEEIRVCASGPRQWDTPTYDRLVNQPLTFLTWALTGDRRGLELIERTRDLIRPLSTLVLPRVLEHGDLGSPNLFLTGHQRLGVVDWELSDPEGFPLTDLLFFLAFVAGARRSNAQGGMREAFQHTFFGSSAWGRKYVTQYARTMALPRDAIGPLFLLCWCRYLAGVVARMQSTLDYGDEAPGRRLRREPCWTLWESAVERQCAIGA